MSTQLVKHNHGLRPLVLAAVCALLALLGVLSATHAQAATAQSRLLAQARAALAANVPATDGIRCWYAVTIRSAANGLYVSTELGYSGGDSAMLRARASVVGAWEQYTVCRDQVSGSTFILSDANGLAVAAELGYSGGDYGMLRARTQPTRLGPWEFYYTPNNPGSGVTSFLATSNNLYVSAELGYSGGDYGMLRARATIAQSWETFTW